jgi:hypothetical protein
MYKEARGGMRRLFLSLLLFGINTPLSPWFREETHAKEKKQ